MGFLNKLFKSSETNEAQKSLPWKPLNNVSTLDEIVVRSEHRPQVIFKHSTRCGISSMVINRFIKFYDYDEAEVDLYYLDLLNYREVSNEVGYKFQVLHQSPQLIIIKNGETVHHASHHSIDANVIETFV